MGVYNLPIAAVWALYFLANGFIDSCAICFGDDLDIDAAFAAPCGNSLNHKSGPPKTVGYPIRSNTEFFRPVLEFILAILGAFLRQVITT